MSENPINLLPQEYSKEPFVNVLKTHWEQLTNLQTISLQQKIENVPVPKKKGIFSKTKKKHNNEVNELDNLSIIEKGLNDATTRKNCIRKICEIIRKNYDSKTENGEQINAMLMDLLNGSDEKSITDLTQILTSDYLLKRLTDKDFDLINAIKRVQTDKSLTPEDKKKYFEALNIALNNNLDKTNAAVRAALTLKGGGLLAEKINVLHEQTKSWEEKNISNKSEENKIIPKEESEENKIIPKNPNEKSTKQKKTKKQPTK